MDQTNILLIAVIVVLVLCLGFVLMQRRRSQRLQSDFGPEYERTLRETGDRRKAEAELQNRQARVEKLKLTPLDEEARQRFTQNWESIQAEFVDAPEKSIEHADSLLRDVMHARGYRVKDFDQVTADISVDHPAVVQNYRTAHDIVIRHQRGEGGTEDLRKAMLNYRELFDELVVETPPVDSKPRVGKILP